MQRYRVDYILTHSMMSFNDYNMINHRILHSNYTLEISKKTVDSSASKITSKHPLHLLNLDLEREIRKR